jgi:GTPase SAR1 family protein
MASDGSLVLIDCKNKSIKVFKPKWYEAVSRHDLDEEPTGIASNGADEIIVTFAHKLEVRRYRIGSEKLIVPLKCFKVNEKPFSISELFCNMVLIVFLGVFVLFYDKYYTYLTIWYLKNDYKINELSCRNLN